MRCAGRVVRHRTGGKLHFFEVQDQTGRVQVMARVNRLTPAEWQVLNLLDLGDIVGIDGEFGKTQTGELTIQAASLTFLTKSLEPHPKDTSGLTNIEARLRQRYLDLLYNPDALKKAEARVKIVRAIRQTLDARGFLEVETPVLQAVASGAAARTVCDAPQRPRHPPGAAHRARTAAEAPAGGGAGARVRVGPGCSATRGSAPGTTPSSPCSNSTRPTAT